MVDYAARPVGLPGCWSSWGEQDQPQIIRTSMDSGDIKVRRRYTGLHRRADVSVRLPADSYDTFMTWFRVSCQNGVMPTNIIEPSGVESIWRFVEAPTIQWLGRGAEAFEASCSFERLPGWQEL